MPTPTFATLRDVAVALQSIDIPVSRPALQAVAAVCKERLLAALASCLDKQDHDGSQHRFLTALLTLASPATAAKLQSLGHEVPLSSLVALADKAPTRFLTALAIATDPAGHPRSAEAKGEVARLLARTTGPAPADPPADAPESPAAPSGAGSSAPPVPEGESRESGNFRSVHAYGSSFALCFNAVQGRSGEPAIMVDAAAAQGARNYDWKNAIHLMLDAREIACVFAVFRKWRRGVEFSAHGAKNDKSFSIERQEPNFFAKVSAKGGGVRAVKILPQDAHRIAILFLEQLLLAYPKVPQGEVINLVRAINEDREPASP